MKATDLEKLRKDFNLLGSVTKINKITSAVSAVAILAALVFIGADVIIMLVKNK